VPLSEGCPAPFSGQLLEPSLAITLGQGKIRAENQLELSLKANKELWDLERSHLKNLHNLDEKKWLEKEKILKSRIEELQPSFWDHPAVIVAITVLTLSAFTAGSAALVNAVVR
jgi:hypothetical protein